MANFCSDPFGSAQSPPWPYLSHQRETCKTGSGPATTHWRERLLWLAHLKWNSSIPSQTLAITDSFNCLKRYKGGGKRDICLESTSNLSWTISLGNTDLGKPRQLAPFRKFWVTYWANFKRRLGLMWSFEDFELELGAAIKDSENLPQHLKTEITIGVYFHWGTTFVPVWILFYSYCRDHVLALISYLSNCRWELWTYILS